MGECKLFKEQMKVIDGIKYYHVPWLSDLSPKRGVYKLLKSFGLDTTNCMYYVESSSSGPIRWYNKEVVKLIYTNKDVLEAYVSIHLKDWKVSPESARETILRETKEQIINELKVVMEEQD